MEKTYDVIAFRQQNRSPIQVAFVAHAGDVLSWAGIPRKSDEMLTGYQRFLDEKRVDTQIIPYFQTAENCSPTAVIVALRKDSSLGKCKLANEQVAPGEIVHTTLTITLDEAALKTDKLFEVALQFVNDRLAIDSAKHVGEAVTEELEEEIEEEETESDEDADDDTLVHLGTSTLERMKQLLDDRNNWKNKNFRKAIVEFVKPVMLIDGQHRTSGAAKIGTNGLPFVVCGLYNVPWTEQVFQFTVVNLKPKRLPPSTITAIAGLSLTRVEQNAVETRLKQAGVRMAEVSMMSLVAYGDESPFANLVDMNVGSSEANQGRLGYTSIKRLASPWYRGTRKSFTLIAKEIIGTNNQSTARSDWREERLWFEFFCAFWETVRSQYSADLWAKNENNSLFVGSHLWGLQEAILSQVDAQRRATWDLSKETFEQNTTEVRAAFIKAKFLEPVREALECIPEEVWTCKWKKTGQDTNQGRRDLVALFSRIISEGQTLGRVWPGWKKTGDWFQ